MQSTVFWLPASTRDSGQPYIATLHPHHTITTCGFVYLMWVGGGGGWFCAALIDFLSPSVEDWFIGNNSNNVILCGVNRFFKSLRWVIVGPSLSFMPSASLGHKWQCRANNHLTSVPSKIYNAPQNHIIVIIIAGRIVNNTLLVEGDNFIVNLTIHHYHYISVTQVHFK